MKFDHASKPFSATLRLLAASYLRDWYRPSHLPFGNNQRKNRLVVHCMFSCGIEPKWPGPRCWEHKNRLLNQLNLSSPSFILNVFFLRWVCDKNAVLFLFCRSFSRVSAFLPTDSAAPPRVLCSTESPLLHRESSAPSKFDSSSPENVCSRLGK